MTTGRISESTCGSNFINNFYEFKHFKCVVSKKKKQDMFHAFAYLF